ncbi:LPS export ABC transporter permease LptG [Thiohalobacter sp. COW1]|uniref:LPS export ABC transporter permease LptG n=1 Tax=Thiohalobacter sp. COW1 TaxID=2795687 RepID=UPI001915A202|nr:LPS export ABC transporter permease LptG [Thiohalobacter sp. COW1]BCO33134.1 LPS export ABC transporter permease LptG [Thiohalobacter sp. COW1]
MKVLDRYLGRVVILASLLALLVLLAVDLFFGFINEIQDIGRGSYGLGDVLIYLGLSVPGRIHELFPMAALLGTLLGLGNLAAGHELVAIRAAGVSVGRILLGVMKAGLVLLVLAGGIGEWIAPAADRMAQQQRGQAQSQRITHFSPYGFWARDGNLFIRIREVHPDGRLGSLEVFQLGEDGRLASAYRARTAEHADGRWHLQGVAGGRIGEGRLQLVQESRLQLETLLDPALLNVVMIEPGSLSARDLYRYVEYRRQNALETARYELALWQRLVAPFTSLVMLFLAVPFVFGPLRDRGAGQRLLVGVLVGLGYYLLSQTLSHSGQVYGLPPLLSVLAPPLLFLVWGAIQLRRVGG